MLTGGPGPTAHAWTRPGRAEEPRGNVKTTAGREGPRLPSAQCTTGPAACLPFTDEETEAWGEEVICLSSQILAPKRLPLISRVARVPGASFVPGLGLPPAGRAPDPRGLLGDGRRVFCCNELTSWAQTSGVGSSVSREGKEAGVFPFSGARICQAEELGGVKSTRSERGARVGRETLRGCGQGLGARGQRRG